MAVPVLKLFMNHPIFFIILTMEYVTVITSYPHGCSQSWYLTYNRSSINNYTIMVEPDRVYNLRSPQLYRLEYPMHSFFTWHVAAYEPQSVSLMMYLLFIQTEGYCDKVRVEVDDHPINITNSTVRNGRGNVAYWAGSLEYAYDYSSNKRIFLSTHFMEGHYSVVQFNTDYGMSDVGFMIRVLPLLENRFELAGGTLNTRLTAHSSLQQLELKPGPVDQEIKETEVVIKADNSTRRVMMNILFMNIEHVIDCDQNFIKIQNGGKVLMKACRNMNTTSQPIQVVSTSNQVKIKYRCTTRQLYNQRQKAYTPSPCAILNYHTYEPSQFKDKYYDSDDFVEYKYTDVQKPQEFNGQYLRFSVKSYHGVTLAFHCEKYEDIEDVVTVHLFSRHMYPADPLIIMHELHGESLMFSKYTGSSQEMVNENNFIYYWVALDKDKITIGRGHKLRKNTLLTHPLTGNLQLKYYHMKMYGSAKVRIYSDCDENLIKQATQLPLGPSSIEHTVSKGSIYTRIWTIKKDFPTQLLQFKVTTNLLHNPDCEWEGVTIYRGACPSWRKKVAVYCGRIEELISETTHSVVVIQFHTRADMTTENTFHGADRRYFLIKYQVSGTTQTAEEKEGINLGLTAAIVLSVVIISLVVVVVFYLQVVKKNARRVTTEKISLSNPEQKVDTQSQQIQQNFAQPIQLRINIDNASQMAGVPNVIYDSGSVKTSVSYTGIPPPAVYDPPRPAFPKLQTVQPAQ